MPFFTNFDDYRNRLRDRFLFETESIRHQDQPFDDDIVICPGSLDVIDDVGPTKIVSVDFQPKLNAANHHCEKFELVNRLEGKPIIRRGGNLTFVVTFNTQVDFKNRDLLKVYFSFGSRPSVHKGTQAILQVCGKKEFEDNHQKWDIKIVQEEGTQVTLEVQVPADVPVGLWKPTLIVSPRDGPISNRHVFRMDTLIYILFNPWNKHDDVYLPEEELRQEYVLNDIGKIWRGGYTDAKGNHWAYGQFHYSVLPACMIMMERSRLPYEEHGNPVLVSRTITKMVNDNDSDNGVLQGKWGKNSDYSDGKAPLMWTGSIEILEEYMRTHRPVKYGQCWVFAGVVNTVCRALGIPSRVVTNFNSAHDTNSSLTIDEYYDEEGKLMVLPQGKDSIWNFHVWNDVWMSRPDLPQGYGGWQVIDATPQESSEGYRQCGPASHKAILEGGLEHKYDVPFVLAEVNADVVHWKVDRSQPNEFKRIDTGNPYLRYRVGSQALTKKPGPPEDNDRDREDITLLYKAKEGTQEERAILYSAARKLSNARRAFDLPTNVDRDIEFSIVDMEKVPIGEDFSVTVNVKNKSDHTKTVSATLSAYSIHYTGKKANDIKQLKGTYVIQPKSGQSITLYVTYSDYYDDLVEQAMIKMYAHCNVMETDYDWVGFDTFQVQKPSINVEPLYNAVVDRTVIIKLSFNNPLPRNLIGCTLVVDGPGLLRPKTFTIQNVESKGKMECTLRITPRRAGEFMLFATFNSHQLLDVTGSKAIKVVPANI